MPRRLEPDARSTTDLAVRSAPRPGEGNLSWVNPDGSRDAIHPARVRGRFQRIKAVLWGALVGLYLALPWLEVGGRPALLIDIERRHFFLFGATFNAQDFWLAFFWLTGIGFALIVASALFGRVWCGYACPQTVFLEGVFRRIEAWIDGTPRQRRALARAPWQAPKVARRALKYAIYAAVSLALSHTMLGYFMPAREVCAATIRSPAAHPLAFAFTMGLTAIVFANFTWFREQLCIVVCPYGRLQGVLGDQHTILVGYDRKRGEPRGKFVRSAPAGDACPSGPSAADSVARVTSGSATGATGATSATAGDCVDCRRCVAVCPTGIDIRDGAQLECIGCANCIDACDEVMAVLGRAPGLVRYDSQAGLSGERRRFLRPRLWLYAVLLAAGMGAFAVAAGRRTEFEAALLRNRGTPFALDGGVVTNGFTLHLVNKQPRADTFALEPLPASGLEVVLPLRQVRLESLADQRLPVFVRVPRADFRPGMILALRVHCAAGTRDLAEPILGPKDD